MIVCPADPPQLMDQGKLKYYARQPFELISIIDIILKSFQTQWAPYYCGYYHVYIYKL